MRIIDADKLYPDCMTKNGTLAISQSQIANAPTVDIEPFVTVTFDKDELERITDERVIEPIKNGELVIKEKRPTGHWIEMTDGRGHSSYFCSRCGTQEGKRYGYCPNCGADMRGEEE